MKLSSGVLGISITNDSFMYDSKLTEGNFFHLSPTNCVQCRIDLGLKTAIADNTLIAMVGPIMYHHSLQVDHIFRE